MVININDLTMERLQGLFSSVEDNADYRLIVDKDGDIFFINIDEDPSPDNLLFRFETFDEGNDYVGKAASEDLPFMQRIFNALVSNWPTPRSTLIDFY